ncbi:amino acid dehydrogenase [Stutzerimonas stutzeri]|uniref:Amino acid dehydrogenase n=1 Tax=Stutzerimonas stutzeri TaxID=316 RepID=A0A2S4ATW0_STUST|nr:D-amino acid dehydrogenase [Stutzerimonas stutzeri]MCQ4261630.1 D-amino acid dehydrogenase [Stutzerimonas stutzeri]POH84924.1 amino acid dehydrogenase [Stutzerimonas stutzeri]
MRIAVIGAGVIGLATAYSLVRQGHSVELIERCDDVALETSFANGGQLSYRYVSPLADAGVPLQALGWMLRGPDAPLRFRPQASLHQWRWCLQFLLACRRSVNRRNAAHLLRLALHSQQILRSWREQDHLDGFAWRANGKLVIYRDRHSLHKGAAAIDNDSGQMLLDVAQCIDIEPALAPLAASLQGGIYSPDDEVADCHLLCTELLRRLRASPAFHLHTGQSVSALRTEGKRVRAVAFERDEIVIDHLVVAAGTGSVALLKPLGIDLPIYPLKGYSLTVALADQDRVPQTNVTDYDNKVVYARLDDQLRVAAMVDIAGWDADLDQERIATLQRLAGATFPGAGDYQRARQWAGLRPATPQGTPLIGRSGFDNLWLNVGHGSLGFTLACGSADLLASVIDGSPPAVSLDGLSLSA